PAAGPPARTTGRGSARTATRRRPVPRTSRGPTTRTVPVTASNGPDTPASAGSPFRPRCCGRVGPSPHPHLNRIPSQHPRRSPRSSRCRSRSPNPSQTPPPEPAPEPAPEREPAAAPAEAPSTDEGTPDEPWTHEAQAAEASADDAERTDAQLVKGRTQARAATPRRRRRASGPPPPQPPAPRPPAHSGRTATGAAVPGPVRRVAPSARRRHRDDPADDPDH